tara:strand:- start:1275 stop:1601 length:327 start_codon:yes stop_codon:yes gene_type:complete
MLYSGIKCKSTILGKKMNRKTEWAKTIVEDIGDGSFAKGNQKIQDRFGITESQIYRWKMPKDKTGGSGGIPFHWVYIILQWHTEVYPDKNYLYDIDLVLELIRPDYVE